MVLTARFPLKAPPGTFVRPHELSARRAAVLPTGFATLDELLGGGFPEGRITELRGARGGRTALALQLAARFTAQGRLVAVVDGPGALDPRGAAGIGVDLRRLLWVRPPASKLASAVDSALRSGAFGLVVLDVASLPPVRLPLEAAWVRLARAAEASRTTLLVIGASGRGPGFTAAAALALRRSRVQYVGRGPGRLLQGFTAEVELTHNKLGLSGGMAELRWRAPDPFPPPSDR